MKKILTKIGILKKKSSVWLRTCTYKLYAAN